MKFKTVLFGLVFEVQQATPRYTVVLETLSFTEIHERKTYLGALLAAYRLAKSRDNGWSERAVTLIYDKRTGKPRSGFKSSVQYKEVTQFVKF